MASELTILQKVPDWYATRPALEKQVPEVAIVDLDRTLVGTAASMDRLYDALRHVGSTAMVEKLRTAYGEAEAAGLTFSPLRYLSGFDEASMRHLLDEYLSRQHGSSYRDAWAFMRRLDRAGVPHMVMSAGDSPLWQELKLASTEYCGGAMITPDTDKGKYLSAFRWPDGYRFVGVLPPATVYHAGRLCLIDDKPDSFANWPNGRYGRGFCVQRPDAKKGTDTQPLPAHVRRIGSLDELVVCDGRIMHIDEVNTPALGLADRAELRDLRCGVLPVLNPDMPPATRSTLERVRIGKVNR